MPVGNNPLYSINRAQENESLAAQLTVPNALNFGKGQVAGFAGFPGDLFDLAKMVAQLRAYGAPLPSQPSAIGSEGIGQALGADTESGAFLAGNIGVPDITDVVKMAPLLALKAGKRVAHGTPNAKWFDDKPPSSMTADDFLSQHNTGWIGDEAYKDTTYLYERENNYPIHYIVQSGTKIECKENGEE